MAEAVACRNTDIAGFGVPISVSLIRAAAAAAAFATMSRNRRQGWVSQQVHSYIQCLKYCSSIVSSNTRVCDAVPCGASDGQFEALSSCRSLANRSCSDSSVTGAFWSVSVCMIVKTLRMLVPGGKAKSVERKYRWSDCLCQYGIRHRVLIGATSRWFQKVEVGCLLRRAQSPILKGGPPRPSSRRIFSSKASASPRAN